MQRHFLPLFFFLFSFVAVHAQQTERLIDNNPNYFYRGDQRPEGITAPADSNYMLVSYYQIAPNGVSQFGTLGTPVWIHRDSLISRGFFDGIGGSTSIEAGAGIIVIGTGTEGDPYIITNTGGGGGDNIYTTNGTVLADRTVTAQDQNTFLNFKDFDYVNISNPETDDNIGLRIAGEATPVFDNRLLVLSDGKGQDSVIFYRAYKGGAGGFDIISTDITTLQAPVLVLRGTNSELSVSNGTFTDGNNSRGLAYAADYSANYGNRSIPDVEYVNSQVSGVNTIYNQNGTVSTDRTVTVGTGNSLNITTQNGDGQIFMQDGTGLQISGNTSTTGGRESVSFPNTGGGMQYQANYNNKAGFGDRSIPDWGYVSTHTVDTLSSLADTTAAANNVGRIAHVVDVDQKWTVNSAGVWEILSSGIAQSSLDTLWDYTALRAYTGSANAVFVNKPGLAGLFRRVASGTDNGGTVIVASNSVVWERSYSGATNVTWFGATPDDDTDDTPAFMIADNHANGHLYIPRGVFLLCDMWDIDGAAGPMYIEGAEGATLKRCDGKATTVLADVPSTASFVTVVHPDTFKVGDFVSLLDADKPLGGIGTVGHSLAAEITSIIGDTLFLDRPLNSPYSSHTPPANYQVGDIVFKFHDMIRDGITFSHWDNIIFDGNKENNSYTLSWTGPKTMIQMGNAGDIVERCVFQNIPCENIFHRGEFTFRDNKCIDLNGSATHYSNGAGFGRFVATGNMLINVSLVSRDTAGHNEAAFVCSAQSDSTIIMGNTLINDAARPAQGFYGNANSNDDNVQIIANNLIRNANYGVELNTSNNSGNPIAEPGPVITGNLFYDVPNAIADYGNAVDNGLEDGDSYINTTITGNTIVNGRIFLRSHHSAIIANNNIRIDSLKGDNLGGVAIQLTDCALTTISENNVYNHPRSSTATSFRAINILTAQNFTGRRNNSSYHIIGNTFHGFNVALGGTETQDNPNGASVYGVTIENNILYHRDSSSVNDYFLYALMQVRPGYIVRNNTLHVHPSGRGMMIRGISAAEAANHNGPVIYGNTIIGGAQSMVIGKNNSTLDYNITCVNNYITAPLDDNTTGGQGNTVSGNIVLPVNEQVELNPFPNIRKFK